MTSPREEFTRLVQELGREEVAQILRDGKGGTEARRVFDIVSTIGLSEAVDMLYGKLPSGTGGGAEYSRPPLSGMQRCLSDQIFAVLTQKHEITQEAYDDQSLRRVADVMASSADREMIQNILLIGEILKHASKFQGRRPGTEPRKI